MPSADQRERILAQVEEDRDAIEEDIGTFTVGVEGTEVVIRTPSLVESIHPANDKIDRWRCYLVEGRLVYDDYFPPPEED